MLHPKSHVKGWTQAGMTGMPNHVGMVMPSSILAWQHRLPCWHGKTPNLPENAWVHSGLATQAAMLAWEDTHFV